MGICDCFLTNLSTDFFKQPGISPFVSQGEGIKNLFLLAKFGSKAVKNTLSPKINNFVPTKGLNQKTKMFWKKVWFLPQPCFFLEASTSEPLTEPGRSGHFGDKVFFSPCHAAEPEAQQYAQLSVTLDHFFRCGFVSSAWAGLSLLWVYTPFLPAYLCRSLFVRSMWTLHPLDWFR